jgi:hypothetical protein
MSGAEFKTAGSDSGRMPSVVVDDWGASDLKAKEASLDWTVLADD